MGILWWIRCGSQEDQEQIIIHSHTSTSATEWISLPFPFSKSAEHSLNLDGKQSWPTIHKNQMSARAHS